MSAPNPQGPEFRPFQRLPREIRAKIWVEAIPRRLISPRVAGTTWVPLPPTIASVCSESRFIALKYGQPYAIDKYEKCPSSGWFTPSRDIVLFHGDRTPKFKSHPVFAAKLWRDVHSIVVQDAWSQGASRSGVTLELAMKLAASSPKLKEIMIFPWESQVFQRHWIGTGNGVMSVEAARWDKEACEELFGAGSVKIVDLRDPKEVKAVKLTFVRNDVPPVVRMISWSHNKYIGAQPEDRYYWNNLVVKCQVVWLKACFEQTKALPGNKDSKDSKDSKDDGGNRSTKDDDCKPVPVQVSSPADIDINNPWIRETLAKMPLLRPVVLLAQQPKPQERLYLMQTRYRSLVNARSHRPQGAPAPTLTFNEEFKLWMKTESKVAKK
ncbi:hypothetical protein BKA67DRAFT_657826 [Truncatella angustata]|uniref:2EXR domain-containing protein n=1 Tax=Truncatella angustata TaxID=152316 RepID=A0A9P8ZZ81_9PEZI|nr:uncharacterized protein BKA67DRAFT_657826 [Truncatella angustata]KAH6655927.1 hypothetical protein BKA67DRAFT_657826 [Truncatella angustata]KAH8199956.1 hypothetical protein TruAng_005895 [Truncatella angustata]